MEMGRAWHLTCVRVILDTLEFTAQHRFVKASTPLWLLYAQVMETAQNLTFVCVNLFTAEIIANIPHALRSLPIIQNMCAVEMAIVQALILATALLGILAPNVRYLFAME